MSETLDSLANRTAGDCASHIELEALESWHDRSDAMCPIILIGMQKAVAAKDEEIKSLEAGRELMGNAMNALGIKELEHQLAEARKVFKVIEDACTTWSMSPEAQILARNTARRAGDIIDAARAKEADDGQTPEVPGVPQEGLERKD